MKSRDCIRCGKPLRIPNSAEFCPRCAWTHYGEVTAGIIGLERYLAMAAEFQQREREKREDEESE